MSYWTLDEAVDLCRHVEAVAPKYGCHVALTGGSLYKDGKRKDVDILFYRSTWAQDIDMPGLLEGLRTIGLYPTKDFGRVHKAAYRGKYVDMFFPERTGCVEGEYADVPDNLDDVAF